MQRKVLKLGSLLKQPPSCRVKKWSQRWFVLESKPAPCGPTLSYYKNKKNFESKKAPSGVIYLTSATVTAHFIKIEEAKKFNKPYVFGVSPEYADRNYIFAASSISEAAAWVKILVSTIEAVDASQVELPSPSKLTSFKRKVNLSISIDRENSASLEALSVEANSGSGAGSSLNQDLTSVSSPSRQSSGGRFNQKRVARLSTLQSEDSGDEDSDSHGEVGFRKRGAGKGLRGWHDTVGSDASTSDDTDPDDNPHDSDSRGGGSRVSSLLMDTTGAEGLGQEPEYDLGLSDLTSLDYGTDDVDSLATDPNQNGGRRGPDSHLNSSESSKASAKGKKSKKKQEYGPPAIALHTNIAFKSDDSSSNGVCTTTQCEGACVIS